HASQGSIFVGSVTFPAVADVNGDGRPDLLREDTFSGSLGVLFGNGDGSFGQQIGLAEGFSSSSLAVADVNGDGRPDPIGNDPSGVSVLLGAGGGSFLPPRLFAV